MLGFLAIRRVVVLVPAAGGSAIFVTVRGKLLAPAHSGEAAGAIVKVATGRLAGRRRKGRGLALAPDGGGRRDSHGDHREKDKGSGGADGNHFR